MLGLPGSFARCWWARSLRTERISRSLINIRCFPDSFSSKGFLIVRLRGLHSPRKLPQCVPSSCTSPASQIHTLAFGSKSTPHQPPLEFASPMFSSREKDFLRPSLRRGERFCTYAESTYGSEGGGRGGGYESKFYGREMEKQADRKYGPRTEYAKHKKGKKVKGRRIRQSPKNYRGNKQAYKDLIFKWFLQAYPESLSRQEIAGRLNAHPKKVKGLIIKSLVREGKLMKWGQRTAPYERYMPVIKAPDYYEVTGEEPPKMPSIDENEVARNRAPGSARRRQEDAARSYDAANIPTGFQDAWDEGGQLGETEVQKLQEISSLQGWSELFEDPSDEEESDEDGGEEEEAVLLARMKAGREREQRRAQGEDVDSEEEEESEEEYDEEEEVEGYSEEEEGKESNDFESGNENDQSAARAFGADDLLQEASFTKSDGGSTASSSVFADIDFGSSAFSFDSSEPSFPASSPSSKSTFDDNVTISSSETESRSLSVSDLAGDPFFNPKKVKFDSDEEPKEGSGRASAKGKSRSKNRPRSSFDDFDEGKFEEEISSSTSSRSFKDGFDGDDEVDDGEEEQYLIQNSELGSTTSASTSEADSEPSNESSESNKSAFASPPSDESDLSQDHDDGEFLSGDEGDHEQRPPLNRRTPRRIR